MNSWKKSMTLFEWPEADQEVAMYSLYRMREWMDPEDEAYKKVKDPGHFDTPAADANKAAADGNKNKEHASNEKHAHNPEADAKKYTIEAEKK